MKRCEAYRKMLFICSRYAGDIEKNVETARSLCRMAVDAGYIPFAPHLLFTQFMDDSDPAQRELGIAMGLQFMGLCNEVWVYVGDGISEGMKHETAHARQIGKPVIEITEVKQWSQA